MSKDIHLGGQFLRGVINIYPGSDLRKDKKLPSYTSQRKKKQEAKLLTLENPNKHSTVVI